MRARWAGLVVLSGTTVWGTYRALVTSRRGQRLDQRAMEESVAAAPAEADGLQQLLDVVSVPSIGVATALLSGVALRRGRPDLALGAAAVVGGANLSTQGLKRSLRRPDLLHLGKANSFPSGHVTVVASIAAAAVLVTEGRARVVAAAAGSASAATAGAATVLLGWHRPSDVVGAVAVVAGWYGAVAGVVDGLGDRVVGGTVGGRPWGRVDDRFGGRGASRHEWPARSTVLA